MFAFPRISRFLQSRLAVGAIKFFPGIVPADFFATGAASPAAFPLSLPADQRKLTFNGTAALYQAAVLAGLSRGDQVLLPAYCCGSELGPFEHLECDIRFYRVTDELQVNVEDLFARVDERTKLVYVTHYFGTAERNIQEISAECERRGIPLLEDCALCLYAHNDGKPLGSFGDFAIFSQRKSLPLTEGGTLVVNKSSLADDAVRLSQPPWLPRVDRLLSKLLEGLNLAAISSSNPQVLNRLGRLAILFVMPWIKPARVIGQKMFPGWATPDAEGEEAVPVYGYAMSRRMCRWFERTNAAEVVAGRRANFKAWLSVVEQLPDCRPVYPRLEEGDCPLYFPVYANDRDAVIEFLAERDIEASYWWQGLLPEIDWEEHANLVPLKESMVVLPTHHRMTPEDILRRLGSR